MTDTERFLYEYSDIKQRIRELERQVAELEIKKEGLYDKLLGVKAPTNDRVMGGPLYDPVVEAVAQLVDVYAERIRAVTRQMGEAHQKLVKIETLVGRAGLTETETQYVRLRYFERGPAWKVANAMGYSDRQSRDIKTKLLEKMDNILLHF